MAGVPFEVLGRLATPDTASAGGELLVRRDEFEVTKRGVEQLLQHRGHGLSEDLFRAWRKAIRTGALPPAADGVSQAFARCWEAASKLAATEAELDAALAREVASSREVLLESARTVLPPYLVFVDAALRERLIAQSAATDTPGTRNKQARAHERHLLLYLQRVAGKNDSLSAFGPAGWGTVSEGERVLRFAPLPGITERHAFLERWTAHGAAAAMNADPEVRAEICPRVNPLGRVNGEIFIFADGREVRLNRETLDLLKRCNGETPAHSLGEKLETLAALAQRGLLRWEIEVPAMVPFAFNSLVADVKTWRPGKLREQWLHVLEPIAQLPNAFAANADTSARVEIIRQADERLRALGIARKGADRFLYSAGNPIGEECFRECGFSIGGKLIDEVATDAAPWIDLWRDCYAFVASRVASGLRNLLETAPLTDGTISLAAFIHHCAEAKTPLHGPVIIAFAHAAFGEIKTAFHEHFGDRAAADEWELTEEDCRFVRDRFVFPRFDEYTYPSADLQLGARSLDAVNRGEYQWILAELHPPVAMLHHGFYWSCPDPASLAGALTSTLHGKPSFHFGFYAADFTATTTVQQFDSLGEMVNFVAPERSQPGWKTFAPSEVNVVVDADSGDVGLRSRADAEYLGSFARSWLIPLGFHPFLFSLPPHTPRLRCGKVIVQRRSWTVTLAEFPAGKISGVSRELVVAIERLRAAKGWPRHLYIRPTETALRRSGGEGRDKDTKPVYIDLESYLFLEIFHRWLVKAGELEVTEMLPDPDHLLWQEADGRRTFELRTLMVPRL